MKGYMASADEILRLFNSHADRGLTSDQAEENGEKYGRNILERSGGNTLWNRVKRAVNDPMLIMLMGAGAIALGVNVFRSVSGGEGNFLECLGIFIAIALSAVISIVMEGRSAKAFEALEKLSENISVRAVRDGETVIIGQKDVVAGDVIRLSAGDKVPADGRLIDSSGLQADESVLTGESVPVEKDADACITDEKTPLAERMNMLYSGTYITGGTCRMVVTAVGAETEFGAIAGSLSGTDDKRTPLQEKLAGMGRAVTATGVAIAGIVFACQLVSMAVNNGLNVESVIEAFVTSVVLIVAVVPEGLPTIVAVSLAINVIRLSRENALVRKMTASETIGCINVICSDKTGTLTENKMKVSAFHDVACGENEGEISGEYLILNVCINSTGELDEKRNFIGNPTECAMLKFYEESGARAVRGRGYIEERNEWDVRRVFPFSSETKRMTTVCRFGQETLILTKGSPEAVMKMCSMSDDARKEMELRIECAQEQAMRVIAFAHRRSDGVPCCDDESGRELIERDMVFDGFAAISDPLREEVYDAVKKCTDAGIELKILTGDNIVTARAIAEELHILDDGREAVEASCIDEMTDEELADRIDSIGIIARSTPDVKMRVVGILKAGDNVVAVTGDGINDAPALRCADVGVAMGISGTEVSKEASDIVLLDDSFATIVKAVEWGRNIYENFRRFISFQLTVNFAAVAVVFISVVLGMKEPFTALEILWINLIMDGPPALTLGLERDSDDLMRRKPVRRNENIISKSMLGRIALTGAYISAICLCQYIFNFLGAAPAEEHTVLFTLFVFLQLFNSFNCKTLGSESIVGRMMSNRSMLAAVGAAFAGQVLIIEFAGAFFGTVPLGGIMWLKLFLVAASVTVVSELVKYVVRLCRTSGQ